MTASAATNYASTRLKGMFQSKEAAEQTREESQRATGQRIAQTLGELKGAVMKVGQMASIAADVLPKEIADALGTLQKEAPPMDYAVIEEQIEKELGALPDVLFKSFDREPFASASIGQVHRAVTDDGRDVICKVQYPGVDGAVDSDLRHLKLALRASGLVNVGRKAMNETFAELRRGLHEELDYTNEANMVRLFKAYHDRHDFITIPNVVPERSSQRVLTLEFEPGDAISTVYDKGYDQETRDLLGVRLFTLMASEIFEFGAIHADPNPGNFACRRDGTLVVYDFGCIKRLPRKIPVAYRDVILDGLDEDYDRVDDALLRLGIRRPDGPRPAKDFYKQWRDMFSDPFLENPVFDYGQAKIHDDVVAMIPKAMRNIASFQPAKEMVFLDRMVAGHYGNLRLLKANVPVLETLKSYLDAFDPDTMMGIAEANIEELVPTI